MAQGALTPRETAAWDQLAADLADGARCAGRPIRRAAPARASVLAVFAALVCALSMLVAARATGFEVLAWAGVIMWVTSVLAVSHLLGHGPRPPWR